jgi:hypothetical protein
MRHIRQLSFFVFHVCEDLIQICGVERMNIILCLRGIVSAIAPYLPTDIPR